MKLTILDAQGTIRPTCECCLREFATMYDPDPYASEINGDYTKYIYMCEDCYRSACDDI
jgi:hypothetical protein